MQLVTSSSTKFLLRPSRGTEHHQQDDYQVRINEKYQMKIYLLRSGFFFYCCCCCWRNIQFDRQKQNATIGRNSNWPNWPTRPGPIEMKCQIYSSTQLFHSNYPAAIENKASTIARFIQLLPSVST